MIPDIATYFIVFAGVLLLTVLSVPQARRLGLHLSIMDQPDAMRKVHKVPTPRMGGGGPLEHPAVASCCVGSFVSSVASSSVPMLVSFLGLRDDRFNLGAGVQLAWQLLAAVLLIATGVTVWLFSAYWITFHRLLACGHYHAMNLLDNMDGLSAGSP